MSHQREPKPLRQEPDRNAGLIRDASGVLLLSSTAPLVVGGTIYLLWRDPGLLMFQWLKALHLNLMISSVRHSNLIQSLDPPEWIAFSLPNALWVFALVSSAGLFWHGTRRAYVVASVSVATAVGVGAEIAQGLTILPGTFTTPDLLSTALAATCGVVLSLRRTRHAI